jgi:hypothetical protein
LTDVLERDLPGQDNRVLCLAISPQIAGIFIEDALL